MNIRKRASVCSELYPCDKIVDAPDSTVVYVHPRSLALADLCIDCPRVLDSLDSAKVCVIVNDRFPMPQTK